MKIPKFKIEKIKQLFKKLPRTLGEQSFLTFFGLLLIALILGGLIFYQYSFLVGKEPPTKIGDGVEEPLKFEEKIYDAVLKTWQEKEKRFEEVNLKEYPDLFR